MTLLLSSTLNERCKIIICNPEPLTSIYFSSQRDLCLVKWTVQIFQQNYRYSLCTHIELNWQHAEISCMAIPGVKVQRILVSVCKLMSSIENPCKCFRFEMWNSFYKPLKTLKIMLKNKWSIIWPEAWLFHFPVLQASKKPSYFDPLYLKC